MQKATSKPEFDPTRQGDFQLVVEVGNPYEPEGLTRAILDGSGNVVVEHERSEPGKVGPAEAQGPRASDRLGSDTTKAVLARASAFAWGRKFPPRHGIPGEAVVTWTLVDRRGGQATMKVWLRDAEKDETMSGVLSAFRQAVDAATEGRLYL